jgi:hypothetical protein
MDNGDLVPVEDERGPVRLEHRLAVLLALAEPEPVLTAREVVLLLFNGNAFALGAFTDKLVTWMVDPDAEVDPGES